MINKLHERALRILLKDHISDAEALLHKNNHISELYKIKNELTPPIMDSMLDKRNYFFRNLQEFQSERKKKVFYRLETLNYLAPQIWSLLPEEIKHGNTSL